jgi:hypothetical protein
LRVSLAILNSRHLIPALKYTLTVENMSCGVQTGAAPFRTPLWQSYSIKERRRLPCPLPDSLRLVTATPPEGRP